MGLDELRAAGVRLVLYPLTAFRAMAAAADRVYATLRSAGTQRISCHRCNPRDELYQVLDYQAFEEKN